MASLETTDAGSAASAPGSETSENAAEDTFEIGIALAGAVSAGAYTAGVLDFLFEALDAWSLAKANGEDVPNHNVVLRVITGASAGGMNGAIAAAALHYDYPHTRAADGPDHNNALGNPFYAAWVKKIDMGMFLELSDLKQKPLPSLLDSSQLETIVREIVEYEGPPVKDKRKRAWIANPLPILLTVSNLRGVPYNVHFSGSGKGRGHGMILHEDHLGFAAMDLSGRKAEDPYAWRQDQPGGGLPIVAMPNGDAKLHDLLVLPAEKAFAGAWKKLGATALATGAFPAFLASRLLERPGKDYEYRYPYIDADNKAHTRPPAWPDDETPDPYSFLCVDGGAMNNEPFELARLTLAGQCEKNPRKGKDANKAVVMIDPLTDGAKPGPNSYVAIHETAGQLLSSLVQQARFTPTQYALAADGNVYSRFMIAPSRRGLNGDASLAGAGLGAFLGFFSEDYQRHDFLLGRRNCQKFLKEWFTLPVTNPLFETQVADWDDEKKERFRGKPLGDAPHYQIVPLVGDCNIAEACPCWPKNRYRLDRATTRLIERRVKKASSAFLDELLARPENEGIAGYMKRQAAKVYLKGGLFFARGSIAKLARDKIEAAVKSVDERVEDEEDCVR
jgi:hypothetical protein